VDDTLKIHLTGNNQEGSIYDSIWYNGVLQKGLEPLVDTFTIVK
jgi:hypothetical protein